MGFINLKIPVDEDLLRAAGKVAIAHANLEHILRMTVKTLAKLTVQTALDATQNDKMHELRKCIFKLFRQLNPKEELIIKLKALLRRSEKLSEERNSLLHRPWAVDEDRTWVIKDEDHNWGNPPKAQTLEDLAQKIESFAEELNHERLKGFLAHAIKNFSANLPKDNEK